MKPKDLKLDAKILIHKITLSSELITNIESEQKYYDCNLLMVREKKKSGIRFLTLKTLHEIFSTKGRTKGHWH
jgi:hypothetical protein